MKTSLAERFKAKIARQQTRTIKTIAQHVAFAMIDADINERGVSRERADAGLAEYCELAEKAIARRLREGEASRYVFAKVLAELTAE